MSCRLPSKFGNICNSTPSALDVSRARNYTSELAALLTQYNWLAIHAYDICVANFYNTTWPNEWQSLADEATFRADDLIGLVKEGILREDWPESFKEFVERCHELALPRNVDFAEFSGALDGCDKPIDRNATALSGMARKKLYEVERFSSVILDKIGASSYKDTTTVIDIGAGQGYLTHRLTTKHPCVAVDFDEIQTVGSKERGADIRRGKFRDSRAEILAKSKGSERKPIEYRTMRINKRTLLRLVENLETSEAHPQRDFALVGLHACGDLSASAMLDAFRECASVKLLAVVPCCFNLLTTELEMPKHAECQEFGFPVSEHVRALCSQHCLSLNHTARNLACQNFESISKASLESSLHNHYKRALLNALLAHYNLETETKEPTKGSNTYIDGEINAAELCNPSIEKKYHKFRLNKLSSDVLSGPFVPYALAALACLGLADKLTQAQVEEFVQLPQYANAERQVFVVHCVRSLLSRVVESFLLMDRYLALCEM